MAAFYLNSDTENNKSIRLVRIKDIVNDGCTSPVIYLEAINILNAQPVLLRVLNKFEIKVINFGCRYGIINESSLCRLRMWLYLKRMGHMNWCQY